MGYVGLREIRVIEFSDGCKRLRNNPYSTKIASYFIPGCRNRDLRFRIFQLLHQVTNRILRTIFYTVRCYLSVVCASVTCSRNCKCIFVQSSFFYNTKFTFHNAWSKRRIKILQYFFPLLLLRYNILYLLSVLMQHPLSNVSMHDKTICVSFDQFSYF